VDEDSWGQPREDLEYEEIDIAAEPDCMARVDEQDVTALELLEAL
jgi:hypothetical protein